MLSSSYYYDRYKEKKKDVKSYDEDLKKLRKALDNLTGTMNDEIRAINTELEDLKSDLNKSIRHNSNFTSYANAVTEEKETTVSSDSYLSTAISELEEAISQIDRKRTQAITDRDDYYQKYQDEKENERREFFDNLF